MTDIDIRQLLTEQRKPERCPSCGGIIRQTEECKCSD